LHHICAPAEAWYRFPRFRQNGVFLPGPAAAGLAACCLAGAGAARAAPACLAALA
jgi:hypothetical protein